MKRGGRWREIKILHFLERARGCEDSETAFLKGKGKRVANATGATTRNENGLGIHGEQIRREVIGICYEIVVALMMLALYSVFIL